MKMKSNLLPVVLVAFGVALASALPSYSAPPGSETVKPTRQWTGTGDDEKLAKEQPGHDGVVTDKDTFAKIWKTWMPNEKTPDIDFEKQFVIVQANTKSSVPNVRLMGDKGSFEVVPTKDKKLDKGFSFVIAAFDREGINTVGGKSLKK
jgi:hypothetical protein